MSLAVTQTPPSLLRELHDSPAMQSAFRFFAERADEITKDQIRICTIPAPPFGERERALFLLEQFTQAGLNDAALDEVGNCLALRKGRSLSPLLVVSAHLDTVFPPATDCTVRRDGQRLLAPGISDDGAGLAALMALARALEACPVETEGSLLFVGTVGEEGEGDLRGVRHLFTGGEWARRIDAFISLDGPGVDRITNSALGSRRYRVSLTGKGGHSWGDFGAANPVHALGRVIARLVSYPAPRNPRTTFNVGRIEGGASINVIPCKASMDVDLRSADGDELRRLDAFFRRAVYGATADENSGRRKSDPPLELNVQLIGDRPSGETPANSLLLETAIEATSLLGHTARLDQSSTDSNIPISLGIPSITLGAGGTAGNTHTLEEWYDPRGRDVGLKRTLLIMLGMVGAAKVRR
jgi:acetylornithine deacetylase/succinyl-diaminopimelate desuccinylase-like protein